MSLEEYTPDIDSSENGGNSTDKISESSFEKYKESSKKASVGIKKTQKDEKKAKKYDFLLAGFLVKIIVDKKYDTILDTLFKAIHTGYPSNFILGVLSLINIEISDKIRENSNKEKIKFNYNIKDIKEKFDDKNIDVLIRNRITNWVEDITDSVTIEYSNIQTQKLKKLLIKDETILLNYTSKIFSFFLSELNILIDKEKSDNISLFIISEIEKSLKKLKIKEI